MSSASKVTFMADSGASETGADAEEFPGIKDLSHWNTVLIGM